MRRDVMHSGLSQSGNSRQPSWSPWGMPYEGDTNMPHFEEIYLPIRFRNPPATDASEGSRRIFRASSWGFTYPRSLTVKPDEAFVKRPSRRTSTISTVHKNSYQTIPSEACHVRGSPCPGERKWEWTKVTETRIGRGARPGEAWRLAGEPGLAEPGEEPPRPHQTPLHVRTDPGKPPHSCAQDT